MGVLVLRIGGPRLVTAFSKSNMLPCTSSIKSFLSGNYPITYNYNKTIEEIIEANIAPLLATKHLISLKMDELVIVPRIKWSSETNEIVGTCFNHKDHFDDYLFNNHMVLEDMKAALTKGSFNLKNP